MPKLSKQLILALPKWTREHLLPLLLTIRVAGLLLAALALGMFALLANEILTQESYAFDKEILLMLRELHTPLLDKVMLGFTYLGQPSVLLSVCLGLSMGLLLQGDRSQATVLGIAGAGAMALNVLLKSLLVERDPCCGNGLLMLARIVFPVVMP